MKSDVSASAKDQAARRELDHLVGLFDRQRAWQGVPLAGEVLPAPFRALLRHDQHMTLVLQTHHKQPLILDVLASRTDGDRYLRMIRLCLQASKRAVEAGIVKIDLAQLPDGVRAEVLLAQRPLGDLLTAHDVMRRIDVRWYFRFGPGSPVRALLGIDDQSPLFGRLGTIYCDEKPAIELLEIVTG